MRVYRVRKQVTSEGKLRTYHADVMERTAVDAMEAARWGRVENWRIIIESDAPAGVELTRYSYVCLVAAWDHRDPQPPEPKAA